MLAKGEGSSCNKNGFPAKSILKLKRAWSAQFLHHTLKILRRATTFVDVQMVLLSFFDIFTCVRFRKSMWESSVHILRRPWTSGDIPVWTFCFENLTTVAPSRYFFLSSKWSLRLLYWLKALKLGIIILFIMKLHEF